MEYETRLPAVHLQGGMIAELEELLRSGNTDPEFEIRLDHGSIAYTYSSTAELRRDVGLPDIVRSFRVVLAAREGEIELLADDVAAEFRLRVSGDEGWVESRRRTIEGFFQRNGATVRTLLERYMALAMSGLAVAAGLAMYYGGFGGLVGMRTPIDALLYGSVALIAGGILHLILNRVYPYAAVVTGEQGRRGLVSLAT